MKRYLPLAITLAVCLSLAQPLAAPAADRQPLERFTAFAASLGTGKTAIVDIGITRWSTEKERETLLTALKENGPEKLVQTLQRIRPPVGWIRSPNHVSYELYYARDHRNEDGSRRIVLATNRRVTFRELTDAARSLQYQVTLIEIHIDKNGKGEGKIVPAAKITWNAGEQQIHIENYDTFPVELLQVRPVKP